MRLLSIFSLPYLNTILKSVQNRLTTVETAVAAAAAVIPPATPLALVYEALLRVSSGVVTAYPSPDNTLTGITWTNPANGIIMGTKSGTTFSNSAKVWCQASTDRNGRQITPEAFSATQLLLKHFDTTTGSALTSTDNADIYVRVVKYP